MTVKSENEPTQANTGNNYKCYTQKKYMDLTRKDKRNYVKELTERTTKTTVEIFYNFFKKILHLES